MSEASGFSGGVVTRSPVAGGAGFIGWHAIAFFALFACQAVYLDADPSFLKRFGDFGDEGYWQHNARCKVLFNEWLPDEFNQAFIAAPLFTLTQWLVFSALGVSLATARLLPLVAFWLILLMWYAMLRREFSPKWALGVVCSLGVAHELLIYAKWSTPIVPEMLFSTCVAFFVERGTRRAPAWFILAGLSLAAATAMKSTAVYFFPAIALFFAVALFVRRDCDWKRAFYFMVGATAGLAGLAGFFLANLDQYHRFRDAIAAAALSHFPSGLAAGQRMLLLPITDLFCYPSMCWITVLASLWAFEWLIQATRIGLLAAIRAMSQLECFLACWLIGSGVALAVLSDKADRRCVGLLLPLALLAATFVRRQFVEDCRGDGQACPRPRIDRWEGWRQCGMLWIAAALYWSVCLRSMSHIAARALGIADAGHRGLAWAVALSAGTIMASLVFSLRKTRAMTILLVALFFLATGTLDGLWYACATFSVRDASRGMARFAEDKAIFLGPESHELALENRLLPIFSPWNEDFQYNAWFAEEFKHSKCLVIAEVDDKGRVSSSMLPPGFPDLSAETQVSPLEDIDLCPPRIARSYRFRGVLYRCAPTRSPQCQFSRHGDSPVP